ncbi:MAG: hypothetical protein HC877_08460 [Thioploca sp.]|nr:hypothetical protein [Thioploca sp.]
MQRNQIIRWLIVIVLVVVTIDICVGNYQSRLLAAKRAAQAEIERMAWFYVRTDVDKITYTADNRYQLTLWIENLFPEREVFVMMPLVQGAVQVGPQWQEVKTTEATRDSRLTAGSVIPLTGRITVDWLMEITTPNYFQAFPGYMHLQIHSQMLVSPELEPQEHVAERNDVIYIHLKPIGSDDNSLRIINGFPREAPIFIPTIPRW